jgi:hypothetical protein
MSLASKVLGAGIRSRPAMAWFGALSLSEVLAGYPVRLLTSGDLTSTVSAVVADPPDYPGRALGAD